MKQGALLESIPTRWEHVTVEGLSQYHQVMLNQDLKGLDKQVAALAAVSGLTVDQVEYGLTPQQLVLALKRISFLEFPDLIDTSLPTTFIVKGQAYKFLSNFQQYTAAQLKDLETCGDLEGLNNIHELLAVCCIPVKHIIRKNVYNPAERSKVAAAMKACPVSVAIPIASYFTQFGLEAAKAVAQYHADQVELLMLEHNILTQDNG